jgi:hypothetical protein
MWLPKLLRPTGLVIVVVVLFVSTALAQQPPAGEQPPAAEQPAEEGQEQEGAAEEQQEAEAAPEAVPEGIELVEGSGYRYDSRGRRDPFVSLAQGYNLFEEGVRPPGLAGMLIQEVSLHGIVKTADEYIAMIQGTDNKSYFARVGERLYDGTIEAIDDGRVVFRQEINDPLRIEKFHRIEKSLHPVEEGK